MFAVPNARTGRTRPLLITTICRPGTRASRISVGMVKGRAADRCCAVAANAGFIANELATSRANRGRASYVIERLLLTSQQYRFMSRWGANVRFPPKADIQS